MDTRFRILLIIILILTLAGLSGVEAYSLLESLYQYRSPLKNSSPASGEPIPTHLTNKVILVLMDALREDTSLDPLLMPTLNRLRSQGAWASMTSQPPSYSSPGYATILTGAWPEINDGPAFNLEYGEIPFITQNTIFTVAKQSGLKTAISGYYWFEVLIPQNEIDRSFYTPGEDRKADRKVMDAAIPFITDPSINLILVHIDQIDYAGHYEGGPQGGGWKEAANRSDQLLSEIVTKVDLSITTLLIISDHGQIDQGGHGGKDAITLMEPFVAVGSGINPGAYDPIRMVDIAPTIAVLLGTRLPASAEGEPLVGLLNLTSIQKDKISLTYAKQQAQLISTYKHALLPGLSQKKVLHINSGHNTITAIQQHNLQRGRLWRVAVIGSFLGLFSFLGYRKRSATVLWMFVGAVAVIIVFHLEFSVIAGNPYSFSIINEPVSFVLTIAGNMIIALLFGMVAFWSAIKLCHIRPSNFVFFSLSFNAFSMILSSVPALCYIAMYGLLITDALPDIGDLFIGMLSLAAVMLIGLIGLPLTGLLLGINVLNQRYHKIP